MNHASPTVVPIDAAPNWAALRFGLGPEQLDMRILRGPLDCEHIGVGYLRFGPDWRPTVGHRHPGAGEEVYVLVEGRATMKVDDEIHELEAPAAIRVRGDRFRAIRAAGGAPAVFVVAGWPIEDPDATEIVPDFWPAENG